MRKLLIALLLIVLAGCSSHSSGLPPGLPTESPSHAGPSVAGVPSFYASAGPAGVVQVSARSGKVLRAMAPAQRHHREIRGLSRADAHDLLITYASGPACTSNVAGCGPRPGTCGAEVDTLDLTSGKITTMWSVGPDQLLYDARVSPDRRLLVALAAPCVPSYFNEHLVVRRLGDGATWTIGSQVPRCHLLGPPAWTADSAHVLVTYAPPIGTTPYNGADGICTGIGDSNIVKVDVTRSAPTITGQALASSTGCTFDSLSTAGQSAYAVQACGGTSGDRIHGPASLLQFDNTMHVTQHWPIGNCTDGSSLAGDTRQGVILAAYLFCNPPLSGTKMGEPTTTVDLLVNSELNHLINIEGGNTAYEDLTW